MNKIKPYIFYTAFFLLSLAYSLTARAYDYDLWARLIAGMGVFQTGSVIKADFLSYTPTHAWIDHEWGSGVIFYAFQHYLGAASLVFLQAILIFLVFFIIAKIVKLNCEKPHCFFFYFLAFQAVIVNLNQPIRCHLFSFAFFALTLYVLELARGGKNKPLFLLPFLMIFWNNVHGGVVSGIGLIVIYLVGEFLNRKPIKKYLLTLIFSASVLIINPYGVEYLKFLLMANTMKRPDIIEWWGLFNHYHLHNYVIFKLWAVLMILIEWLKVGTRVDLRSLDKTKFLLLASTLYLAIIHVKLLPFFVIVASSFVYPDFYRLVFKKIPIISHIDKFVVWFVVLFSLIIIAISPYSPLVDLSRYPVKEIEFVKTNQVKGKLLVSFGLGSYASYKLYPDNKIFMDGRYEEVYYDYMIPLMKKFYLVNVGWDEILRRFPPDVIIVEKSYPVYVVMKKKWREIYEGELFGVFVPKSSPRRDYKLPSKDIKYYKETIFDTNVEYN